MTSSKFFRVNRVPISTITCFTDLRARNLFCGCKRENEPEDYKFFAIIDPKTTEALGFLSLERIEPKIRCIEIGNVLFSPRMQQSPAGTDTVYLLMRYVFDDQT